MGKFKMVLFTNINVFLLFWLNVAEPYRLPWMYNFKDGRREGINLMVELRPLPYEPTEVPTPSGNIYPNENIYRSGKMETLTKEAKSASMPAESETGNISDGDKNLLPSDDKKRTAKSPMMAFRSLSIPGMVASLEKRSKDKYSPKDSAEKGVRMLYMDKVNISKAYITEHQDTPKSDSIKEDPNAMEEQTEKLISGKTTHVFGKKLKAV